MITINDCRAAGYCVVGVRRHCATVGIDFRELMRAGIPVDVAEKIDDAAVRRIVLKAKERSAKNG